MTTRGEHNMTTRGGAHPVPEPRPWHTPRVEGCECKRVGDILVVTTAHNLTVEQAAKVRAGVEKALPGQRAIIVPPGWDVHTVRATDLRALRDSIDAVLSQLAADKNKA